MGELPDTSWRWHPWGSGEPPRPPHPDGWELREAVREFSPALLAMILARSEFDPKGADGLAAFGRVERTSDLGQRIDDLAGRWWRLPLAWRSAEAAYLARELVDRLTSPDQEYDNVYELRFLPANLSQEWQAFSPVRRRMLDPHNLDLHESTAMIESAARLVHVFWREDETIAMETSPEVVADWLEFHDYPPMPSPQVVADRGIVEPAPAAAVAGRRRQPGAEPIAKALLALAQEGKLKPQDTNKTAARMVMSKLGYSEATCPRGLSDSTIRRLRRSLGLRPTH